MPRKKKEPEETPVEAPQEESSVSVEEPEMVIPDTAAKPGFNLLAEDCNLIAQTKEGLMELAAKKKKSYEGLEHNTFDGPYAPFDHLGFQIATGMKGLLSQKVYEVMGKDKLGKTSLFFTWAGMFMNHSIPSIYVETEGKPMLKDRIARCMDSNPKLGALKADRLMMEKGRGLLQTWNKINEAVEIMRQNVPKEIPIAVFLDTYSKLLSGAEAAGRLDGQNAKKKETGEAANFGHSKFAHSLCRELPWWTEENNIIFVVCSHINDDVSMGYGHNDRVKIGGNAFNQNAALQLLIKRYGQLKVGDEAIGYIQYLKPVASSYSSTHNDLEYYMINKHRHDTPDWQEPAMDVDVGLANALVGKSLFGLSLSRKRYTSKELNLTNATARQVSELIHKDTDLVNHIGTKFGIAGYTKE
jgi:hypothetical protein